MVFLNGPSYGQNRSPNHSNKSVWREKQLTTSHVARSEPQVNSHSFSMAILLDVSFWCQNSVFKLHIEGVEKLCCFL